MDGGWLYNTVYEISHYAPLVILIAATLDIFFMTGYILYGAAMLSTVLMMHMTGMITTEALIASAFLGTVTGNIANYWAGRLFGETVYLQKKLQSPRLQKTQSFLRSRGLLIYMIVGRFITFTRPIYAVVLGSMQIRFDCFLIREIPLALFWVTFWLLLILEGEAVLLKYISN